MIGIARLALAGLMAITAMGTGPSRGRAEGQDRRAQAILLRAGLHRAGQGLFPRGRPRRRAEILRCGAADRGGHHLGRHRFRRHRLHRRPLQSRRQGRAEGDRRHEPREGRLSPDRLFRQQQRLCERPEDAEGPRGQARGDDAGRLLLSLFARPACRQIRLQARRREDRAAAIAVERGSRAEGRDRGCSAAADLHRAKADGRRRCEVSRLGRRRDAVATGRGVRFAEDADQQGAGDEVARRFSRKPTANITTSSLPR